MSNTDTTTQTVAHTGRWAKNPEGKWMVAITEWSPVRQTVGEGDTIVVVKRDGERQVMVANGDFDFPCVDSGRPNLFGVRKPATAPAPRAEAPEGVHVDARGRYVLVATSAKGYRFGKVWDGHGFTYERGAIAGLSAETVITAEQAAEFGHTHHRCVFCRHDLSTPESTEVGYGPVCAKTHGLPWGTKQGALV
jgi:hypothetical protein